MRSMKSYLQRDGTINLNGFTVINNFKWSTWGFEMLYSSLLTREVVRLFCEKWGGGRVFLKCFADLILLLGKGRAIG